MGMRFAASYHISPATALGAAEAYRKAFVPSNELERPYVAVSADVVVAPDDESARQAGRRIRLVGAQHPKGRGRDPVPRPRRSEPAHLGR